MIKTKVAFLEGRLLSNQSDATSYKKQNVHHQTRILSIWTILRPFCKIAREQLFHKKWWYWYVVLVFFFCDLILISQSFEFWSTVINCVCIWIRKMSIRPCVSISLFTLSKQELFWKAGFYPANQNN